MLRMVLLLAASSFAQIGISGFLAVPVGDFASSTDGMAETRFGLSVAASKSLGNSVFAGIEAGGIMNTLDRETFAKNLVEESGAENASVSGGTYFNFPIFGTLAYSVPLAERNSITLHGGLGYDFLSMMDMEMRVGGGNVTTVFDPGGALAFSFGASIGFGQFFVGAKYMNLGEHKIKAVLTGPGGSESVSGNQEIAVIGLLIGFNL